MMGDTEFSTERLLRQASGNQSALFFVALRWARDRDGSVDKWATFVGEQFADGWAEMRGRGAYDVARTAGLNFASSADSKFANLTGDEQRAEALIEGPDPEWLKQAGVSANDSDRANELIFRPIARSLGMSVEAFRDDAGLHLVFAVA
jgi:hypothetical protein